MRTTSTVSHTYYKPDNSLEQVDTEGNEGLCQLKYANEQVLKERDYCSDYGNE